MRNSVEGVFPLRLTAPPCVGKFVLVHSCQNYGGLFGRHILEGCLLAYPDNFEFNFYISNIQKLDESSNAVNIWNTDEPDKNETLGKSSMMVEKRLSMDALVGILNDLKSKYGWDLENDETNNHKVLVCGPSEYMSDIYDTLYSYGCHQNCIRMLSETEF